VSCAKPGDLIKYKLRLENTSEFSITGGVEDHERVLYESYVLRVNYSFNGKLNINNIGLFRVPIIPSSTLKGALRDLSEKIARELYSNVACNSIKDIPRLLASLHHQPNLEELQKREGHSGHFFVRWDPVHSDHDFNFRDPSYSRKKEGSGEKEPPVITSNRLRECLEREGLGHCRIIEAACEGVRDVDPLDWCYEYFASRYCPLDLLYGSPLQAGAVRVTDAVPMDPNSVVRRGRSRVAINRRTGIASHQKLFREEVVEPGSVFESTVYLVIPPYSPAELQNDVLRRLYSATVEEALRIWNLTLKYVEQFGLYLGSGKTHGKGRMRVEISS